MAIMHSILILFHIFAFEAALAADNCFANCQCSWVDNYLTADCSGADLSEYDNQIPDDYPIQHIDFSHNQFAEFPYFLAKMEKLSFVDLTKNNLWHLEENALEGFTELETLLLNNNSFSSWKDLNPNTAFKGAANLRTLSLAGNPIKSFSNTDETFILISHSLFLLDLSNCDILKVSGDFILSGMPNLEALMLNGNPLRTLSPIVSESLRILELINCSLGTIVPNFFNFMKSLVSLDLSMNGDLKLVAKNGEYPKSESLLKLNLSYCNLYAINIMGFPQLSTLLMTNNMIDRLDGTVFEENSLLEYINLSGNAITSIDPLTFSRLSRLKQIDLSHNLITSIHPQIISANTMLLKLDLIDNPIAEFNKITSSSLIKLNLSGCAIAKIHPKALSELKNLKVLDISLNFLSHLPSDLRSDNLEELDLSMCRLSSIRSSTFKLFPKLIKLKLSGNLFTTTFLESYFRGNPFLDAIWLGDNTWICSCDNPDFRNFYTFITQRNKLKDKNHLLCGSPREGYGQKWESFCAPIWYPQVHMGKAEKIWTIIMITIIVASVALCSVSCIRNLIKKRKQWMNERRQEEINQQQWDLRNANASILQQAAQLNAPDPRESSPPCYEDALLMPKLEQLSKSMGELNTNRDKRKLVRSKTENDIIANFDEQSVPAAQDRFLSEERLSNRDKERTDIGRKVFRQTGKLSYDYYTDDRRFPAAHLKSQNLQSAEHIANFSNNRKSPYSDRKWKMCTDSISFASISDEEIGVHRSCRNKTSAQDTEIPGTSRQTRASPYSRRRPRGLSVSQLSLSNENCKDKQQQNISQSTKDLDLEIVSDHFKESDSLISNESSSGFELMTAEPTRTTIGSVVGSSGRYAHIYNEATPAVTQDSSNTSSNI